MRMQQSCNFTGSIPEAPHTKPVRLTVAAAIHTGVTVVEAPAPCVGTATLRTTPPVTVAANSAERAIVVAAVAARKGGKPAFIV